jgi:predicted RNase H-like HicB family nuclease
MQTKQITVHAEWDAEAKVWVATSDDVPGLITEAGTVEALTEKLSVIIPELLEANGILPGEAIREVPINLIAHPRTACLASPLNGRLRARREADRPVEWVSLPPPGQRRSRDLVESYHQPLFPSRQQNSLPPHRKWHS